MKINIYTAFNGVGLEKDYKLLKALLKDHEIYGVDWLKREAGPKCDLGIHLEIPRYDQIMQADKNILVPNPEWFAEGWKINLRMFDEIWCKTQDSFTIFKKLHQNCHLSGFVSEDFSEKSSKKMTMIHVAGKSSTKGTAEICEAYRLNPDLPECLIVSSNDWPITGNLKLSPRVEEAELKRLLNQSLIHLCPSSYEGWGHYLHESASTGAVIITTDAAPMNEFFSKNLIKASTKAKMNVAQISAPDINSIAETIREVFSRKKKDLAKEGLENREAFLKRNEAFIKFLGERIQKPIPKAKDVVVIPCFDRPEYLKVCLEQIQKADMADSLSYVFALDIGGSKENLKVIKQFPFEKTVITPKQHSYKMGKQSYNVMSALLSEHSKNSEFVYYVEDDVFIGKDFFTFSKEVLQNSDVFACVCSKNVNAKDTVKNNPNGFYIKADLSYQGIGVCFRNPVLREVLSRDFTDSYFKNPAHYISERFPHSKINKHFVEQDGLIRRIIEENKLTVAYCHVPRCFHGGFYGYHRMPDRDFSGMSLEDKVKMVKEVSFSLEEMKKTVKNPKMIEDSLPVNLETSHDKCHFLATGIDWKAIKPQHPFAIQWK